MKLLNPFFKTFDQYSFLLKPGVITLCFFIICALLYFRIQVLLEEKQEYRTQLTWLKSEALNYQQAMSSQQPRPTLSLLDRVNQLIREGNWSASVVLLKKLNANTVQLNLENVSFDDFIARIAPFSKSTKIVSLDVEPEPRMGFVRVLVLFKDSR